MRMYRIFAVLLALALLGCIGLAEGMDAGRAVSLTIAWKDGEMPLQGAGFDLYRVAKLDASGNWQPEPAFRKYNVQLQGLGEAEMGALAMALEGYVLRDAAAPVAGGATDENGRLYMNGIGQGLYLVLGRQHAQDGRIYEVQPGMVQLPCMDVKQESWIYDAVIQPKYESRPDGGEEKITRKVLKDWDDAGRKSLRPEKVEIQLLCNGEVYDTVSLTAKGNWRHTWKDLDASCHWTVVEKEMDDYTVRLRQEGITFIVTNTYCGPEPVPTPTPEPDSPSGGGSGKLPQTGQLWWPVPMLVAAGLLMIIIGLLRRRGK